MDAGESLLFLTASERFLRYLPEIFSQHIAEGCENILLIEGAAGRAYEKAEMVHSQDYPIEIDSHSFLWVKADLWCWCG